MKHMITALQATFFITILGLAGCSDGPAEDAGERVDEAITDVQNKAEDLCEKAKENLNAENENC
ncbi:hypothetical protein CWB99_11770 [Pseudoalteromonas rubra]|uniref:Lipoprotein n=1 Tax=Pseudoalteromonas rubra TaxID=43658 RepID=A0A5S3WM71_9GAMM|nr:hypothetical protein CWB99_11770 [Pseudoalteromonas rubra]TMP37210.1 hypothetical protein CWC00_00225 [Pseudoalteromonas rubra]